MNDNYYNEFKYEIISETKDTKEREADLVSFVYCLDIGLPHKYISSFRNHNITKKNLY